MTARSDLVSSSKAPFRCPRDAGNGVSTRVTCELSVLSDLRLLGGHHGFMTGHVFVVHGRIEKVVHDVAIVPTATDFHIRDYWQPILGENPQRWRPAGWPGEGFARARGRDDVWFLSVGGRRGAGAEVVVDRAVAALREIASEPPRVSRNRIKPLVAVPVLGIRGGGLNHERGAVVRRLLAAMTTAAGELDVDVALVTPDASVYAAAQHLRRQLDVWPLPASQLLEARRIGQAAREGQLALFMGAGVSIPAGLPKWKDLLTQLATEGGVGMGRGFEDLNALDQAQLLHNRIPDLGDHVARIVSAATVPALGHALLASLGCAEAVTTNYDRLYEDAVRMQRGNDNVATVLPWDHPGSGKPWVLKLHGDVKVPDSIVLTRRQFVSFDAATRPAGALLQSLLMTRHVLFVGASLADDNVVRLAYEVDEYRRAHGLTSGVGTLLDVNDDEVRRELWQEQLTGLGMGGLTIEERSRSLEVFLDVVAAHASNDASWLLDARFRGLLDLDVDLVRDARDLYRRASAGGPEWQGLADVLASFGATAGNDVESRHGGWRHPDATERGPWA